MYISFDIFIDIYIIILYSLICKPIISLLIIKISVQIKHPKLKLNYLE